MPCLAESTILRFVEQSLSPTESNAVEEHVDVCPRCRKLLLDVAQGIETPSAVAAPTPADSFTTASEPSLGPRPGTAINERYLVLEMLGMGGMGRVYSAYDRQLDRKIALKFLRHEQDDGYEQLLREAKALAKLSHPNVIVVYDVGRAYDQTYMAMEFVDGPTVKTWLSKVRPNTQRIIEVFLDAGGGLAAAHRAGLIHRDFKPENVLIGSDDRVRVTDFGLARPLRLVAAKTSKTQDEEALVAPSEALNVSTRLEGTPLYIAPERFAGKPSDARSDQFAFCVSLYEALYGEYPFLFDSAQQLPAALTEGRVRPVSKGSRVPARVRAVLLKGLSPDPSLRFESMDALLGALRGIQRRTWLAQVVVLVLLIGIGAAAVSHAYSNAEAAPPMCQGAERNLMGVWDDGRKSAMESAFLSTKLPYAESSWKTVRDVMDHYATKWLATHRETCLATRMYGEQSEEVLDRRTACLNGQLVQFRVLSQALVDIKSDAIAKAPKALEQLGEPAICASMEIVHTQTLPFRNEQMREQVEGIRARIAKADVLYELGRAKELGDEFQAIKKEADAIDYLPLQAEVGLFLGRVFKQQKGPDEIRRILQDGLYAAEAGRHERTALKIWLLLGSLSIWHDARYDDAEVSLNHAEAYLQRVDGNVEKLELLMHRSALRRAQARLPEALAAAEQGMAHAEKAFGPNSTHLAHASKELGINLHLSHQYKSSREALKRSIEITERALGPDHPLMSGLFMNYGNILAEQDPEYQEEAIAALRRAVEITKASGGLRYSSALSALAYVLISAKQYEEGLGSLDQAIGLYDKLVSASYPDRALDQSYRGVALVGLGRYDEGCAAFSKAVELATNSSAFKVFAQNLLAHAQESLAPCPKKICKDTLASVQSKLAVVKSTSSKGEQP